VRGIVGLSSASTGTLTRLSRPAHIVLYGKDAPTDAQPAGPMVDAGVAADGGMQDAGTAPARADAGAAGRKAPQPSADAATPAAGGSTRVEATAHDAGEPFDAAPLTGGCSCAVTPQPMAADACSALGWLLACGALFWRRARR
jgi:hypothetical protein